MHIKLLIAINACIWGVCFSFSDIAICRHHCRHLDGARCLKIKQQTIGRSCVCGVKVTLVSFQPKKTLSYKSIIRTRDEKGFIKCITYENSCHLSQDKCVTAGCSRGGRSEMSPKTCARKPQCPTFTFELIKDPLQVGNLSAVSYGRSLCDRKPHSIVTREALSTNHSYYWEVVSTNPDLIKKKNGRTILSISLVDTNSADVWKNVDASALNWSIAFMQTVDGMQIKLKNGTKADSTTWRSPQKELAFLLDRQASLLHVLGQKDRSHLATLDAVPKDKPLYLLISIHNCQVYLDVLSGDFLKVTDDDMGKILTNIKSSA